MAKEQQNNMANWMKLVLGVLILAGVVFGWGQAYNSHHTRIAHTEEAVIVLAGADEKARVALDSHKEDNLTTEKEMVKKHEAMLERQHQNELMVQRQLTVSESLAKGQIEAKQERKEDRVVLIKMSESIIKMQAQVENLERAD